jgi:tetratricopeptide (TPR) repeat protein
MRRVLAVLVLAISFCSAAPTQAQESELEALRAAARSDARGAGAQRALGMALLRAGRYREAEQQLARASRVARGSLESLFDIARVSFARGDHGAAERACNALSRLDRTAVLTRVCHARADLVWNRAARAFGELETALAAEPNHYEALYALGEAHRLRAAVPEAESAYQRALSARATEAEPHLGLGRLYAAAGRRDDAIRALRRAVELAPTSPEVQFELGRVLPMADEARQWLERAVQGRPSWPEAQVALGEALISAARFDEAEAAFRAAIRSHSTYAPAHSGLGRALMLRNELATAESSLRRALALVANDPVSALALGDVLARAGRIEDAFEQYRHAADLDLRDPTPLLRAGQLALERNLDVLASGFADRVLGQQENLAAGLALYGDIMRARGDRAEARRYYERALQGTGEVDRARIEAALREVRP